MPCVTSPTSQAKKIAEHKRKWERKREERELKERAERVRKAREEQQRRYQEQQQVPFPLSPSEAVFRHCRAGQRGR